MLTWLDIKRFTKQGSPAADHTITKTDDEWKALLSPEAYRVTRQQGTEAAFSSGMCNLFQPGLYACICCDTRLFDSNEKFDSGTGWPSFVQPYQPNAVAYRGDNSFGMQRVETLCNSCGAHLGHVFPDGPEPSGLRYCINAAALKKVETTIEKATFGGGCFWCTEAMFQQLTGVISVESGYSSGKVKKPSYREVCSGLTGHAEVIQVTFDNTLISYIDLLKIHLSSHNPTTLNQQGADKGTQYRSIIVTHNDEQKETAEKIIAEMQPLFDDDIVTEIKPYEAFYKAEDEHQNYYLDNRDAGYCQVVIQPKLEKFRSLYLDKLKKN